jgi:outer membrane protein
MNHSERIMTKSRRIIMGIVTGLVFAVPQTFAAQGAEKVGVVDAEKIMQLMPETKQAKATLDAAVVPLQKELERMQVEYQKAVAAYKQQAASMAKPARDQKEKELIGKGQAIEKYQMEKFGRGGVVEKKQQELLTPIRQKEFGAIEAIAQQEGYAVIVDKGVSLYVLPEHDLTYKVMNRLNVK